MIRRLLPALLVGGVLSVAVIGLPSTAGAVPIPWKNCGSAGDLVSVTRADASVWPPQAGQPITLSIQFTLARDITGGNAVLTATPLPQPGTVPSRWEQRSFQSVEPQILRLRPAQAGPYNPSNGPNGVTFTVPSSAGMKAFNVDFDAHDNTGARLICLQATVPIKAASSADDVSGKQRMRQDDMSLTFEQLWMIFIRNL